MMKRRIFLSFDFADGQNAVPWFYPGDCFISGLEIWIVSDSRQALRASFGS
jgi:hypothetical protein